MLYMYVYMYTHIYIYICIYIHTCHDLVTGPAVAVAS